MSYAKLLDHTLERSLVRDDLTEPHWDELEIQSHWFAGHFSKKFISNEGQDIRIISIGEWNRGAGPDFINATISIDGIKQHGPIELDLDSRNWDLHGHAENTEFDDVILHIVLNDRPPRYFTRTSSHRDIPRILIAATEVRSALGKPRLTQAHARPGLCFAPLAKMPANSLSSLLEYAARHRASLKATRFHRTVRLHGFEQALWESFADSLGFSANRLPMRLLAQRLSPENLRFFRLPNLRPLFLAPLGSSHLIFTKKHPPSPAATSSHSGPIGGNIAINSNSPQTARHFGNLLVAARETILSVGSQLSHRHPSLGTKSYHQLKNPHLGLNSPNSSSHWNTIFGRTITP